MVLKKISTQSEFSFQPSHLKVTNDYYARYEAISGVLDRNPEILDLVHSDLVQLFRKGRREDPGPNPRLTADTVLRTLVCQVVEGESLRGTVIRVDESNFLRRFTRIYNGPMVDFTWLCRLKNAIAPETWTKINRTLAAYAVKDCAVKGEQLRIDTTAFETNVHWPSDSTLLWDTYRVLARLIDRLRRKVPKAVGSRHLQIRRVRRLMLKINRMAANQGRKPDGLKRLYEQLLPLVVGILEWVSEIVSALDKQKCPPKIARLRKRLDHFHALGLRVVQQTRRRVLEGDTVPNDEKVFSIFEEHTELLKRGKAGKDIEFGHMIAIQQVEGRFITGYSVMPKREADFTLLDPALKQHEELFGRLPELLAADTAFNGGAEQMDALRSRIETVAIPQRPHHHKDDDVKRQRALVFKMGQRFRAGIEGTISFLKRALGLWRCLNKGWTHYVATVGSTVFAHNLLLLADGFG